MAPTPPQLFLVVLTVCCVCISLTSGQHCLPDSPADRRQFYHMGRQREVAVLTSGRRESRILAKVFGIFAEEVLGYKTKLLVIDEQELSFDFATQFSRLSTCNDPLCNRIDPQYEPNMPHAMITLDMWLPPSRDVDSWGLVDAGQLGPAVRFGLLTPNATHREVFSAWNHWKVFKTRETSRNLKPTQKQLEFILKHTTDKRESPYCRETYCTAGLFTPPQCQGGDTDCGLLIASFTGTGPMYNTSMVIQLITDNNLFLSIAFVGPNMAAVLDYMDTSTQLSNNSYVVLHYYPSILASRHKLEPMLVPQCEDPLLQRDKSNPACFFNVNRLAKVVWMPVQKEAPKLYSFIHHFSFLYEEFEELLKLYSSEMLENPSATASDVENEVACAWLLTNESTVTGDKHKSWLDHKRHLMHLQQKPKLYIGGIFPLSGTKYKAPMLADVALMAVKDVNSNPDILPTYHLDLSVFDGQCEADLVMKRFIDIIKTKDASRFQSTVGMLGPACSDTVEPIAGVSKHFRTVVISYSAEGSISKENRKDYPYFFRTIAENKQYKYAYMRTLQKLGWRKVAALTEEGQQYSDYISALQDELQNNGIEFVMNRKFPAEATDMYMYLRNLRERGARLIIGDFFENSARHIMCHAYKMRMTQHEGYVWFLPGWFEDDWYDIDMLKTLKNTNSSYDPFEAEDDFRKSINMYDNSEVGTLPNCTTKEMLTALNGHLSLMHANLAQDGTIIPDGRTVQQWKQDFKKHLNRTYYNYMAEKGELSGNVVGDKKGIKPDKNSGYVYDAVMLYAKALHTLVDQTNQSYIQNLHSDRTVNAFVKIIREMDFNGVSGRINFKGRPSRLSNIRIMQWLTNNSTLRNYEVGVYEPNYEHESMDNESEDDLKGEMISWNDQNLKWQTENGMKPIDNPVECGVLSSFATDLNTECQLAITLAWQLQRNVCVLLDCSVQCTFNIG